MIIENLDLHTNHFRKEIERFLLLTSRRKWIKTLNKIENSSIFYKQYQYAKNPLLLPIANYFELEKKGISINRERTSEILYLAEKSFIINKIVRNLNEKAKKSIISRLVTDDTQSILFELEIAAHFLRNGYEVEFIEYERGNETGKTFDLLIKKDLQEAEVECKSKSYDSGRKIRRDSFYLLSDSICKKLKDKEINCLIDIKSSNKLSQNQTTIDDITKNVIELIDSDNNLYFKNNEYSINLIPLQISQPIKNEEHLEKIVESHRTDHCHFVSLSAANKMWNVILKIESESSDAIVSSVFEELKNAKSQFSKTKPCLLAVRIEGVYPDEWKTLAQNSSLADMTYSFFAKENCPYIHTVSYSSSPSYISIDSNIDSVTKSLVFGNPNCIYHKNENIFHLFKDT